jgi:polygalacturonase
VDIVDTGIRGGGIITGGANDPPGHLVSSYDPNNNFLNPQTWNLTGCGGYSCRPKLLVCQRTNGLTLTGITLGYSPFWTTTLLECNNVLIDQVNVIGDRRWPNNDGIDPINTRNVTIQNSFISVGDDGICAVSHTANPLTDLIVRNCTIESTSAALKLTTFDPKASGDIANLLFDSITIRDTNRGLAIMPRVGSGNVVNVTFSNIQMETRYFSTLWWGSAEPIYITSLSDTQKLPYLGKVSDISFYNITTTSENSVVIFADNSSISNLYFSNVSITISRFGNISHPCRDLRPYPGGNLLPYAPVDGIYINNLVSSEWVDIWVEFAKPAQMFYGVCWNVTNDGDTMRSNFNCQQEILDEKRNNGRSK